MSVNENVLESFKGMTEKELNSQTERLLKVAIGSSSNLDAFGRLRTSNAFDIFDNKNISDRSADLFDEVTAGAGSISFSRGTSSVLLSISQAANDRALRQTRYMTYIPGKSQKIAMTGVLTLDPNAEIYCVLRSSVSGSPYDLKVPRASWDNTVPDINFTKAGIFVIDFQWLGVGIANLHVSDQYGKERLVYSFENSFQNDSVYMRTPSLPMRYEIKSDGTYVYSRIGYFDDNDGIFFEAVSPASVGTYTLREICCSCASEGGIRPIGIEYHANTRGLQAVSSIGGTNVIAVRLKNSYNSYPNRKSAIFFNVQFFAEDANTIFEVYKVTQYTDNGSTWTGVNTNSACEYSKSTQINITVTASHMVSCAVVTASTSAGKDASGQVGIASPFEVLDDSRIIKQNYDSTKSQMFLIKAFTLPTTTTNVGAAFTWLEVE